MRKRMTLNGIGWQHLLEALDGRLNVRASDTDLNQLLTDIRGSKVRFYLLIRQEHVIFYHLCAPSPLGSDNI